MTPINFSRFTRFLSLVVVALSLAVAPALAGNGNGNGGGNGKSESRGGGSSNGKQAATSSENSSVKPVKSATAKPASSYGKLNGFLHASKQALLKASPKSAIGKVATVYAGLLESYLSPEAGATPPTIDEIAAALRAAANKPVTSAVIAAVNQRLLETNPELSASLTASGKTPEQLADEIAAAM